MYPRSLTSALALTGLALATLSGASALPTAATAAPFDPYNCHDIYDGTFKLERSCAEANARRRKVYIPPPPRTPQDPPVVKNWRDGIFNQALSSGAGGDGGGGGGNR